LEHCLNSTSLLDIAPPLPYPLHTCVAESIRGLGRSLPSSSVPTHNPFPFRTLVPNPTRLCEHLAGPMSTSLLFGAARGTMMTSSPGHDDSPISCFLFYICVCPRALVLMVSLIVQIGVCMCDSVCAALVTSCHQHQQLASARRHVAVCRIL